MTVLSIPAYLIGLSAIFYMLYIFVVLSRKLGAVTKMKPYYQGLYWSMGLVVVAFIGESLHLTALVTPQLVPFSDRISYLLMFTAPLALAAVIALMVVLRYWSWLFRERS